MFLTQRLDLTAIKNFTLTCFFCAQNLIDFVEVWFHNGISAAF